MVPARPPIPGDHARAGLVPHAADLALPPRRRLAVLVGIVGKEAVVEASIAYLSGAAPAAELPPLAWWGGASHVAMVARRLDLVYWTRVWGARGLLHEFLPVAEAAVVIALGDESWRVRETCAKVVRAQEIGSAADALHQLCTDEVPRVRAAAVRGLARVGESEQAEAVRRLLTDPDVSVATAAGAALAELGTRLDRPL